MSAHDLFADMTNDVLSTFGGKQTVSYKGANRTVATTAAIFLESEFTGIEIQIVEPRWLACIDRADVSDPRRGDILTDASGNEWVLSERISQDEWMDIWALQAK